VGEYLGWNKCVLADNLRGFEKYFQKNEKIVCIFGKMGYNKVD
jgi:hypothetical protein